MRICPVAELQKRGGTFVRRRCEFLLRLAPTLLFWGHIGWFCLAWVRKSRLSCTHACALERKPVLVWYDCELFSALFSVLFSTLLNL